MKITTAEIRRALDLALSEFDSHGSTEWNIEPDFYWDVLSDARYDSHDAPEELGVGQLSDDIRRVKEIAAGSKSPVPMSLVWIGSILRFAGEQGIVAIRRSNDTLPRD